VQEKLKIYSYFIEHGALPGAISFSGNISDMNVGVSLEIDASIDAMASVVTDLDDSLKEFFREKSYGPDVEKLHNRDYFNDSRRRSYASGAWPEISKTRGIQESEARIP
jgi:hypothetical protein